MDLYAENILDHYRNPQNFGELESATVFAEESNPLCGDKLRFGLRIGDGKVEDIGFTGEGCAISLASSSLLTEKIMGKSLAEIGGLKNEDIYEMLGVEISAARVKCALLGFVCLKKALTIHKI